MAYSALSKVYDRLTGNVGYGEKCRYIEEAFKQNNINGIVLDAGCGTGTLTLLLAKKGYDMIGVDISDDMLSVAAQNMAMAGTNVVLLNQDICKLDLFGTVRGAICIQDTLNHIESEKKLCAAFSRISLFMEKGGIFIFDINTPYKHEKVLSNNSFVFECEDDMCVWQNEYDPHKKCVRLVIDVFTRHGSAYLRDRDVFFEYSYDSGAIERLIAKTGFEIVEVRDGEDFKAVKSNSERIIYTVRKL